MKNPIDMSALTDAVVTWVKEHKPSCAEALYQVDSINLACPELAEAVCDIVGYWDDDEDSESLPRESASPR